MNTTKLSEYNLIGVLGDFRLEYMNNKTGEVDENWPMGLILEPNIKKAPLIEDSLTISLKTRNIEKHRLRVIINSDFTFVHSIILSYPSV